MIKRNLSRDNTESFTLKEFKFTSRIKKYSFWYEWKKSVLSGLAVLTKFIKKRLMTKMSFKKLTDYIHVLNH